MFIELREWQQKIVPTIRSLPNKKKLGDLLTKIKNSIRNDINHAGFREDAKDFDSFEKSIKKRYNETKTLIEASEKFDLPAL